MKKTRIAARAAAVAGVVTLGLGLAACGSSDDSSTGADTTPAATTSTGASDATEVCPSGTLTFGVEPYEDAAVLQPTYQRIASTLGDKLGCTVKLIITSDYPSEILAMKNGKLDLAEFGPAGFVFASQNAGAIPVASFADKDGKPSVYTAGIWVKKGSPITSLKDLSGKTVALSSAGSTSGDWVPRYAMMTAGVMKSPTDTSIVHWKYAGGHDESLAALTSGHVDAAEVNSQEEASAESSGHFDPSQYTEIWKSDPILNDPITMSPSLTADQQTAIKNAILGLTGSELNAGGKNSLASLLAFTPPAKGKAMVPVTVDDYKPLFDLQKTLGLTPKDL